MRIGSRLPGRDAEDLVAPVATVQKPDPAAACSYLHQALPGSGAHVPLGHMPAQWRCQRGEDAPLAFEGVEKQSAQMHVRGNCTHVDRASSWLGPGGSLLCVADI